MGKLIPFLFIALDGKSAVAHLRLRIPGHKLRGSWFSFRWRPVRIVIGSHGLIATVFYFKNYATGIQRQHGMPGSCGHLQHRTGFPRKDQTAALKVDSRIARAMSGNFGDHKFERDGVWELRVDYGPGYRVYYSIEDGEIILLLIGGNKKTQTVDLDKAVSYLQDFKKRSKNDSH